MDQGLKLYRVRGELVVKRESDKKRVVVHEGLTVLPNCRQGFQSQKVWVCDAAYPEYRIEATVDEAAELLKELAAVLRGDKEVEAC